MNPSQDNGLKLGLPFVETQLPGRDPDFEAKLSQAQAQLVNRLQELDPQTNSNTTDPTDTDPIVETHNTNTLHKTIQRLRRHSSKLVVGTLLVSSLLLAACDDDNNEVCETRYVTPTPGAVAGSGSSSFGDDPTATPSDAEQGTPDPGLTPAGSLNTPLPGQNLVPVQYCRSTSSGSNGSHGFYYVGSHYYGSCSSSSS
jgi:hypothetical protein